MKASSFIYQRPQVLSEALALLSGGDEAAPIAGGQSLLVLLGLRIAGFQRLIDVTRLDELRATHRHDDMIFLGAAVTHARIEDEQVPDPSLGLMARVAAGIGYRAIRNRGTIGGSLALADPAADWPPCMIALGATYLLADTQGERRVRACDFHLGPYETALEPGELVLGVEIPRLPSGAKWGSAKHARKSGAFADSIAIAVKSYPQSATVVLGALSTRPQRLPETSDLLAHDMTADADVLRAAALRDIAIVDPEADDWRRRCHIATLLRAIREART